MKKRNAQGEEQGLGQGNGLGLSSEAEAGAGRVQITRAATQVGLAAVTTREEQQGMSGRKRK